MSVVTPPEYVRAVLVRLRAHGHLAYLVGGCVRDMIMGVHPQDWDICTSALPDEVMDIFPGSIPTGIKHGTVTVRSRSKLVEVTTFRTEGDYRDHRHPEAVCFVSDLNTDLSRRDFTMNAIALPPEGFIADPFGGVADIQNKLIRCVGEPEKRFEEDALRMFRALRFSCRLGFEIEPATLAAIRAKAQLASSVSAERVRDEIEKLLLTTAPDRVYECIEYGLLDKYLLGRDCRREMFAPLKRLPKKALPRWACLCIILTAAGCITSAESFLESLRLDGRTVRCCRDCMSILSQGKPKTTLEWKRCLNRFGVDSVSCAATCADALFGGKSTRELKAILKSGECFSVRHLAVSGDDLLELGLRGRELGQMLEFLLEYVMEFPENNKRELLLSLVGGTEE